MMDDNVLAECESRMEEAIRAADANRDIFVSALSSLSNLKELSDDDKQYLLYIIGREDFEVKHIQVLDKTLRYSLGIATYIDIVNELSRFKMELVPEQLQRITQNLFEKESVSFCETVVKLIVDTNGYIRRFGRSIWDKYNLQNSSIDISEFEKIIQFSFIVSMLQDGANPEVRLPKLLPLLDSDDTAIPSLLLHQLRPYILNYRGHVITQINKLDIQNEDAIKTIKEYCNSINKFAKERIKCKELNSEYTQLPIIKEFAAGFQEYVKHQFKVPKENSIRNLFKDVCLARGLCSRNNEGEEIELIHFETSTPAPTMNSSLTYLEKIEMANKMLMDWSTITKAEDLWKILS